MAEPPPKPDPLSERDELHGIAESLKAHVAVVARYGHLMLEQMDAANMDAATLRRYVEQMLTAADVASELVIDLLGMSQHIDAASDKDA
jgi:hypothetical protein